MNWEQQIDVTVLEQHNCSYCELKNTAILRVRYKEFDSVRWILATIWAAGKQEALAGEAEFEGQVLNSCSFAIGFCPFCGLQL